MAWKGRREDHGGPRGVDAAISQQVDNMDTLPGTPCRVGLIVWRACPVWTHSLPGRGRRAGA